ncbi:hypothetical protein ARMSODRAFT_980293 [Armillaria solidipes]|uniref:F-box domain-containing protein n=1 Tax=Armillaria solidipes TaxID=1076256 RepID=A0A2H3AWS1_9AGAR|nr:hypothetical protein ARMSODRAFT_980293 [Armillaria solidipes]
MAPPSKKTKTSSLSTAGIDISRFNELMQSNDAPLDEELKVLRQITADAQCITSPMRSVPIEIKKLIFNACIETPRNSSDFECLNTREPPWVLTQVCGDWRTIAENAHELWSHITLDFDKERGLTDDQRVQHNLFLLNLRIVRAQHINQMTGNVHNLFVTIKSSHDVSSNPLFQTILQTAVYWKSLVVSLPMSSFSAWSASRPSFPRLERLKTDLDGHDGIIRLRPQITDVFEVAPAHRAIPSWYSTLSTYECSFSYKAVDELRRMPNIQTLSLACYSHIDVAPISLPCVSYLQLPTTPKGEVADFITTYKQLRQPGLTRIELMFPLFEVVLLQGSTGLPSIPISSISLPPISNTVTHLEIAEHKGRSTEGNQLLLDFFCCFPNLSSLSLRDHSPIAFIRLFKGLTVTPQTTFSLLPHLETVKVASYRSPDKDVLVDFVQSRRQNMDGVVQLKELEMCCNLVFSESEGDLSARWNALSSANEFTVRISGTCQYRNIGFDFLRRKETITV